MLGLLQGVRIIDITTVVLGPYATRTLGDLGADVIKIEPLAGDVFRSVRPGHHSEMGAGFLNLNRNKRSIGIDLRNPRGLAVLDRLVARADGVVHNMRSASAARLGVDFERLRTVNPRLAYCYTAGFGEGGRDSDEPAYDDTIQARSGLAWLNATAKGEPRFLSTIVADKVGGLHLAIGFLAALAARDRTGEAVCLEAPMFESMVSFLLVEQLAGRSFVPPLGPTGYDRLLSPYRKPYRTRDGYIAVIPYNGVHWTHFLKLIGREDLVDDPRVVDPVERSRNIDMLYALIEEAAPMHTTAEWLSLLGARDIPCAPVNRVEALLEDPHLADAGMFREVEHPSEGRLVSVRTPFRAGAERPDLLPPLIGADTRALLREAGYDDGTIDDLEAAGVVAGRAAAPEEHSL
jgi:crotonobetainyl-CoA:carnitine CoA-transferase CaiB-like acyl-CoA transferase